MPAWQGNRWIVAAVAVAALVLAGAGVLAATGVVDVEEAPFCEKVIGKTAVDFETPPTFSSLKDVEAYLATNMPYQRSSFRLEEELGDRAVFRSKSPKLELLAWRERSGWTIGGYSRCA